MTSRQRTYNKPSRSAVKELPPYNSLMHPGQLQIYEECRRFNVVACGRRWGKTILGMDACIEAALAYSHPVAWFAPTYKYLADVWRDMKELLLPYTTRSDSTERRIELVSGGIVDMWSLDGGEAGRGRKYRRVVVDEAALVPDLGMVWSAAIRPTLTDLGGDAFFLSTPRGRNDFWGLYQQGLDPLQEDWQCWQMPTSTNPYIDRSELDAARRDLPERIYQQEYLAEFLEDSAVFRNIRESATATPQYWKDWQEGHEYVIGVDWGKYEDYSVFAIIDMTLGELCFLDRSNRIEYQIQLERLKDLVRHYHPRQVIAESNSIGTPLAEQLRRAGIPLQEFNTTNKSKQDLVEGLMLGLERGQLKILNDPILIGELQAFEATRLPGGGLRYAAPDGYHDDCVMALGLAWTAVEARVGGKPLIVQRARTVR